MSTSAILDLDGTLVDSNYIHTESWFQALRQTGMVVPMWRIHRSIGMGGDQLVTALTSEAFDAEHGDDVRAAEAAIYMTLIRDVEPLHDARELVADLKRLGHTVVLASSAKNAEVEHYIDLLGVRDLADSWTTSADVESTKPEPDLVQAAIDKGGNDTAVMLGDTPYDIEAAGKAGIDTVGLITGGFSEAEPTEAGSVAVFESIAVLREGLDESPFGPS